MYTKPTSAGELLARARIEVAELFRAKWGRVRWWMLNPNEKENYAICWALGYVTADEENEQ